MTMIINEMILVRDILVAKTKGSLLCVRMFESVYTWTNLCYGQARFQEHLWVELDPLPRSTLTGERERGGGCKNSMHMIELYFHRHHISRAACIIILIASKVHNNIVAEFVTEAIDSWKSFSSWLGSNLVNHFPRTYHGTSMHCLSGAQKQFLIEWMVKRPRSSVLKSPRSIVLVLESPSSLATTNPKFRIQGLRPFLQIQTWQYSTHNQIEVTGIVGPEGQSTF